MKTIFEAAFRPSGITAAGNSPAARKESNHHGPEGGLLGGIQLTYNGCTQESLSVTATAKNQISGHTYDAAGNLTSAPGMGSYTYDAENRMTATAGVTYTYDGDGRRVRKSTGKLYWYGLGLDVLLETDAAGNTPDEYIFFGGKRIARRDSGGAISYFFADHLGSSRILTNSSGTVVEDSDFYPFGGERAVVNNDPNPYKFTGKERDAESGLDNFGARYFASTTGRFQSPDSTAYSSSHNPQSWNLYAYTLNNPLKYVDPTGNTVEVTQCTEKTKCAQVIGAATGSKEAAARVTTETKTVQAPWYKRIFGIKTEQKTFIKIEGDIKSFRALSPNAAKLADLVGTKTNVQFSISPKYIGYGGQTFDTPGGFAGTPSLGFSEPFAVVAPNPAPFDADTRGLIGGQIGEIPGANLQETAAHELLGHMWAELFGGQPAGTTGNARAAVVAENEVRKTDPSRGLKIRHRAFGQVIRKKTFPGTSNERSRQPHASKSSARENNIDSPRSKPTVLGLLLDGLWIQNSSLHASPARA